MLFLLTADALHRPTIQSMQFEAMCKFFGMNDGIENQPYRESDFTILTNGIFVDNPCRWRGVSCTRGAVTAFRADGAFGLFKLNLHWLPNSTEKIRISHVSICTCLRTACLPKKLITCRIVSCHLHGSLAIEKLPRSLKLLVLNGNAFTGFVHVQNLPERLIGLYIAGSLIETVYVVNADLPKALKEVHIDRREGRLRLICVDGKRVDKRVHSCHLARYYEEGDGSFHD